MVFSMLLAAIIWRHSVHGISVCHPVPTLIGAIIGIGLTNAMTGTSVVDALNIESYQYFGCSYTTIVGLRGIRRRSDFLAAPLLERY